jgi:hypothetical protein
VKYLWFGYPDDDGRPETRGLLGGLLILEVRDLNHAIQLISNHRGIRMGPWEIRPVQDLSGTIRESEKRRQLRQKVTSLAQEPG